LTVLKPAASTDHSVTVAPGNSTDEEDDNDTIERVVQEQVAKIGNIEVDDSLRVV